MKPAVWKDAYRRMVALAVREALDYVAEGEGFTLAEFATHFDLKITHNLRRRMAELCQNGVLTRYQRLLPNGKMGWYYMRDEKALAEVGEANELDTDVAW